MTLTDVPQLDAIEDYTDGKLTMERLMSKKSFKDVCIYAESAGPELDELALESDFFRGIRDALGENIRRILKIIPTARCSWEPIEEKA